MDCDNLPNSVLAGGFSDFGANRLALFDFLALVKVDFPWLT
jgi:hypothetical protein